MAGEYGRPLHPCLLYTSSNCRVYPKDEAPDAYKDFGEVLKSVELAGLAKPVAKLTARFVIKDGDKADD